MAIIDGSAIRRRRGLLEGDATDLRGGLMADLRGRLPGAEAALAGAPSPGGAFSDINPGFLPGFPAPGAVPGGPFADAVPTDPAFRFVGVDPQTGEVPVDVQQQIKTLQGQAAGQAAVERRLAAQAAGGLGSFVDPATGQAAQFGQGRFLTRPAFFSAGPGLFGGDDINDRIREIGDAVKRRLEELTGAPPSPPEFRSPVPPALNVKRGRFGT